MVNDVPVMRAEDARSVKNITEKNSELVREIGRRLAEVKGFVIGGNKEERNEPEIKCLLDELEVQNATMCYAIEMINGIENALGILR